jgi:GTP diphosphokinase / guanosine-3',5'-bis(diphosphate) 3'-diphosphatase
LSSAIKRLKIKDEEALMIAIARQTVTDAQIMNALMPGSAVDVSGKVAAQRTAISIRGLTAGVAFDLAACCHPIPGDRIVGLRRHDEMIEVHAIDCANLADGVDADWVDLAWGDGSEGATARLNLIVRNEPGALAIMAGILGTHDANIFNLKMEARDASFHTFVVDVEVDGVQHLMRIIAALRAADAITQVERV